MNKDFELSSATSSSNLIKCTNCSFRGPQTSYPLKVNGLGYVKTCHSCTKKAVEHNAKARARKKEQQGAGVTQPTKKPLCSKQNPQPWSSIAPKLARARERPCDVDVFLDLDPSHPAGDTARSDNERAAALIADIRRETGYSFNSQNRTQLSEQGSCFRYNCAQRDGTQTKPKTYAKDPDLQRDRDYMTRFPCGGSLRITINDAEPLRPRIKFVHKMHHIPWVDISPSEEIKNYIIENKVLGPARLWKEIQRKWPETEMEEAQVYNHWGKASEFEWKLDGDQVKSAKMLVEKAAGKEVEVIAIHEEPGMAAIGFALKEPLELWGQETAEIAFDGTFNTNSAHYEISGLVAEGHGQGVPIGFIYTTATDGTAKTGAKLRLLVDFLEYFRERCPRIMFTLTDKERAEIDAFRKVWPKAKHQCCYWHAIRYLETRLSENKPPAPYDPREAWKKFDFIDPTWAPGVFANAEDALNEKESGSSKPRTEVDEQAEIDDMKRTLQSTCRPPVFVLISNGKRIPVWPSPPPIVKNSLPCFCPKEYRRPIIEKFRRHFCHHPQIPLNDQAGTCLTAEEIYEAAVYDMYKYCRDNELAQVWAYLWNCWYAPGRWELWARSSSPVISRMRTTMMVEGFWRLFKHDVLGSFSRPRLDLVTYLIITDVLPSVKRKLDHICGLRRIGRPVALAPWNKALKTIWEDCSRSDTERRVKKEKKLLKLNPKTSKAKRDRNQQLEWLREEAERDEGQYHTALMNWTCSCSSFLMSRFLVCKHLVRQANQQLGIPNPSLAFYKKLRRCHSRPFYRIPGIHVIDPSAARKDQYEQVVDAEISEIESGGPSDLDPDSESDADSEHEGETWNQRPAGSPGLADEDPATGLVHDGAGRVHYSTTEQDHHSANFTFITDMWLKHPRGLNPGLKRQLDTVLDSVNNIVADARKHEARRKRPRTWDRTAGPMFIGNE